LLKHSKTHTHTDTDSDTDTRILIQFHGGNNIKIKLTFKLHIKNSFFCIM